MFRLWLRWSWRDLRARWLQVLAIAAIIALGTGVYTGLSSQNQWRRASYDASYDHLAVHDLLVRTADGTFVAEGRLLGALQELEGDRVAAVEERLEVPTQVDASALSDQTILVPGRIVGVDVRAGGPDVDRLQVVSGRTLTPADAGSRSVILDSHFAEHFGLPPEGALDVGGDELTYVGTGYSPEYFIVAGTAASFLGESGFAVLFAPLPDAQALSGHDGQVNRLAVRLVDGVDPAAFASELEAALARLVPDAAVEIELIEDNTEYRRLYDDLEGDQRLFNIFAGLILAGAAFAAFNLTGRIVEAQRREIGVGMSLGVEPWRIAVRPLLVALQISIAGVALGALFGWFMGSLLTDINLDVVPVPVWLDEFQAHVFARGIVLGLLLTFVATIWPVWRAVRVDPVDAISTRPRGGTSGSSALGRRLRLPGSSVTQLPVREVLRAPRRTLLTALGIAAVIAVLVAVVGMVDSFLATLDRGSQQILGDAPDRVDVHLDTFRLADDPVVTSLADADGVAASEPGLRLGGWLVPDHGGEEIEALLLLVDLDSPNWRPNPVDGVIEPGPGLVISAKAGDDLGVEPGDSVTLRHPRREGLGYSFVETDVAVMGVHGNPYRFVVYMDIDQASLFGLQGIVNTTAVYPSPGTGVDDLKRTLFGREGVSAVESVRELADTVRSAIEEFLGFLNVVEVAILLLAVLIAFNSTSIGADERRREHATMFAFGLPVRTVLVLAIVESAIIGVVGTIIGVAVGRALLQWLVTVLVPQTVPDIAILVDVDLRTYVTAAVLGIAAVAAAPVLTLRRLRRMDIPATLRVVE